MPPPEQPNLQAQNDDVADQPKRASRLRKVAEQAPPPPTPAVDEDGVIDVPHTETSGQRLPDADDAEFESPI